MGYCKNFKKVLTKPPGRGILHTRNSKGAVGGNTYGAFCFSGILQRFWKGEEPAVGRTVIPAGYVSRLNLYETQTAVGMNRPGKPADRPA